MKLIKIITALFFFSIMLFADPVNKVKLELEVEGHLTPINFDVTSSLDDSYFSQIEKILKFNFNHNARTKTVDAKIDNKTPYLFKVDYQDPYLTLSITQTSSDKILYAEDLKLSKELKSDRKKVHQLCSRIHKFLFHEEGIYTQKILFTKRVQDKNVDPDRQWSSEVYQCDFDGANAKQLTFDHSYCASPSSNSRTFFYVSYKQGQPRIYYRDFDSLDRVKKLSTIVGNQLMPEISAQGDQIAFINDAPGNPEVFIQEFDKKLGPVGKPKQVFACRKAVQASPTFSPDGKSLAFVSNKAGSPAIYVMPLSDHYTSSKDIKLTKISKKHRENTKPSWSPDGKKIAFVSRIDGVRQICIYDFLTQKEWQLTTGKQDKENPHWASNSMHLVYNSVSGINSELYLINLNQPKPVRIKPTDGAKLFPVWCH